MKNTTFIEKGKWYKGNTHLHSTRSDGKRTPEEAVEIYRKKGYDFFVMTDHRIYFDDVRYDKDDFLVLSGIEYNTNCKEINQRTHHFTALKKYTEKEIFTDGQTFEGLYWDDEVGYNVTNKLIANTNEHDNFTIYAHPTWSCMTQEEVLGVENFDAIEVCNFECNAVSNTGNGESHLDYLLRHGRKVMAIASDDIHSYRNIAIGGFIVVKAEEYTKESIAKSIVKGSYYSSTGPSIDEFYIEDNVVHAKGSNVKAIKLVFHYRGRNFADEEYGDINEISYELKGDEKFVRCEFVDANGHKAWSNPLYLD